MSLATDEGLQRIEAAICAEDLAPAPGVLVSYLLLTEWVAADGETYLVESRPDGQAYWRTLGLVEAAKMSIAAAVEYVVEDEDEE